MKNKKKKSNIKITTNEACTLQNANLRVQIDEQGNLLQIVNINKSIGVSFSNQGFYWYQGFPGNNSGHENQASGAYIFRPVTQSPQPVSTTRTITCTTAESVQTAVILFNDWTSQEISLYADAEVVEVEWTVGPIPIDDNVGKEIIVRYDTDIQSQAQFYTDANGREVLTRRRDYRPTWNYTVTEPVSGNYYPVNSRIWIKDQTRQFTVLTDRSQGGASINDGSLEIMLHRRLLHDDRLGVGEPLNETAYGEGLVVRGKHVLIVQPPATSALYHRVASQNLYMHPLATYSLTQQTYDTYSTAYRQTWSAITDALPLNVHLLTLDQLSATEYLVRVENYFELLEDDNYSHPVTIDLQSIFKSIGTITSAVELTLGANLALANLNRLDWTARMEESSSMAKPEERSVKDTTVRLIPMDIRTFQVTIA